MRSHNALFQLPSLYQMGRKRVVSYRSHLPDEERDSRHVCTAHNGTIEGALSIDRAATRLLLRPNACYVTPLARFRPCFVLLVGWVSIKSNSSTTLRPYARTKNIGCACRLLSAAEHLEGVHGVAALTATERVDTSVN